MVVKHGDLSSFNSAMTLFVILRVKLKCTFFKMACKDSTLAITWYLHTVRNLLTVREDLCQVLGAQDIPQGGLSQQPSGSVGIVDVGHGQDGILHLVVDHAIHTDSH